jgi:hypothetical protein
LRSKDINSKGNIVSNEPGSKHDLQFSDDAEIILYFSEPEYAHYEHNVFNKVKTYQEGECHIHVSLEVSIWISRALDNGIRVSQISEKAYLV